MGAMPETSTINGAPIDRVILVDATGSAVSAGGGGGLSVTDSANFTAASSSFTPAGAEYNSTPQTIASGKQGTLAMDSVRNLYVNEATRLDSVNDAVTAYQFGNSYANITTATTTTVKSGAGVLHGFSINTFVASATITLYDNTAGSGTKIGTFTLPSTITADTPDFGLLDIAFTTGLTIVTSGATDLTIAYR